MRGLLATLVMLAAIWGTTRSALAIDVTFTPSAQSTGNLTNVPTGSDINIGTWFSGTGYTEVLITIGGGVDDIGALTIVATSTIPVRVVIEGSGSGNRMGAIGSITTAGSSASVTLWHALSSGNIGSVRAGHIRHLLALGTISSVTAIPAQTGHVSDILTLQASGGFIGDIVAEEGLILSISSTGGGSVGTSNSPISIRARDSVGYIQATAVYADISGPGGAELEEGFGRLGTSGGPFVGSVTMSTFDTPPTGEPGFFVTNGDIDADIIITGDYDFTSSHAGTRPVIKITGSGYSIPAGRTITIGGGLLGNIGDESFPAFDLPAFGLEGQIIIGAGSVSESWTAPVKVDGIRIDNARSQPDDASWYDRLSSELGGGSVGHVPYRLHKKDCLPEWNDTGSCEEFEVREWPASHEGEDRETIILRHYGPVFDGEDGQGVADDPDTNPLVIERRILAYCGCAEDSWIDASDDFDVHVPNNASREVWVSTDYNLWDQQQPVILLDLAYEYRITLRSMSSTTQLRSGGTFLDDVDAPGIGGYPYQINPLCQESITTPEDE